MGPAGARDGERGTAGAGLKRSATRVPTSFQPQLLRHAFTPLHPPTFPPPRPCLPYPAHRFLLIAQVVLALQLPVTLVPLIKATSSRQLMGAHASSRLLAAAAWAAAGLVFIANLGLFVTQLLPQAGLVQSAAASAAHKGEGGSQGPKGAGRGAGAAAGQV